MPGPRYQILINEGAESSSMACLFFLFVPLTPVFFAVAIGTWNPAFSNLLLQRLKSYSSLLSPNRKLLISRINVVEL